MRRAVLVGVVAGCLALTSCQASTPSATSDQTDGQSGDQSSYSATPADFAAVRQLLDTRAAAVLHHDEAGFLATVDPQQPDLVTTERVEFENLEQLPVTRMTYAVADDAFSPGPVPGSDPTLRPEAYEHVQLARVLSKPITNPLDDTFVRRGGRWLLGAETQPTDDAEFDAPTERPWFGGPLAVASKGSVLVLTDATDRDLAPELRESVTDDIAYDAGLLGLRRHEPVLVDATSNGLAHPMSTLTDEDAGAVEFSVFATDRLDTERRGLAGHVVKADPGHVEQLLDDGPTLRHELTHLLLHRYGGVVPTWLSEGVAEYVGYYPDRSYFLQSDRARVLRETPSLPVSGVFDLDFRASYGIAEGAVHYLVSTYGMARLVDLMRLYHRRGAPRGDEVTNRVLHLEYGIGQDTLAQRTWRHIATDPR